MSTVALGILVVLLTVLAAAAGLSLVRRLTSVNLRKEHNDVAGFIYSVLGVAYAVVWSCPSSVDNFLSCGVSLS